MESCVYTGATTLTGTADFRNCNFSQPQINAPASNVRISGGIIQNGLTVTDGTLILENVEVQGNITQNGGTIIFASGVRYSGTTGGTAINIQYIDTQEAPIDGNQYARKNAGWEQVAASGGGPELNRWYVSSSGNDITGNGSPQTPYASIPAAVTAREADGSTYGEILLMDSFTETTTVTLSSNPGKTTVIRGTGIGLRSRILNLQVTDTTVVLKGVKVLATTITQTGTNGMELFLSDAEALGVNTTINNNTFFISYIYGSSVFSVNSGSHSLGTFFILGAQPRIRLAGTTMTVQQINGDETCVFEFAATTTNVTTNMTMSNGGLLKISGTLSITGNFTHEGVVFQDDGGTISITGTETAKPGSFTRP
jgi:hypothetical protein